MKKINNTIMIPGMSGNKYIFQLFSFNSFKELSEHCSSVGGIYLFTNRSFKTKEFEHKLIYCGKTEDFSKRFENHHAEACIMYHGANCLGLMSVENEYERTRIETDILEFNKFICNVQHQ